MAILATQDRTGSYALLALQGDDAAVPVGGAQIAAAGRLLARDRLCVDLASTVAAAGLPELCRLGSIAPEETAMCVATMDGLCCSATFAGLDRQAERDSLAEQRR
jgi:threonine synthase